ncbi:protein MAIN-LIKE 1-like [Vicia villosa]|uniref:protein MAIN-LIKE 1-like n=1 Tax=Vicia villosa TaxID=3911 RepID=UPI00273BA8E3|nr:protein MAIN-LIKE 1-like [Vicia villosa]
MLLGIPVAGKVVNGAVQQANALCEQALGIDLIEGDEGAKGHGINLKALKEYYKAFCLNENSSEKMKLMKTRCYLMLLFGNVLFPESTGNTANFMYLRLLLDVDKVGQYSWGSTVLAMLYQSLCKSAKKDSCTFYGCALLFIWRPYLELDHEPNAKDAAIWTAKTTILRYNIVEMHHIDRVKLQFGMHQGIPDPPTDLGEWHMKRVNHQWSVQTWKEFAPEWRRMWKNCSDHVLNLPVSDIEMKPSRQYMSWYKTVTTPDIFVADPFYLIDHCRQNYIIPQQEQQLQYQQQTQYQEQTQYQYSAQQHNYQQYNPF